jgi:hypothetical protein
MVEEESKYVEMKILVEPKFRKTVIRRAKEEAKTVPAYIKALVLADVQRRRAEDSWRKLVAGSRKYNE